jgi:outer membrane protein OmpA-like peptidoglycan-associated protein
MAKNPQSKIKVIGFSDATGTSSYDQLVSEVRANTVKNYLIAKGVASSKISTAAGGAQDASSQTISRVVIEFK